MTKVTEQSYLQAGLEAVHAAGPIALEYFRKPMNVESKSSVGFYDPVTDADKRIEASIREYLGARYPHHRIVGEEQGDVGEGDTYWVIDPIDGTRAFISGMPTWGVLLGLVVDGAPTVGIMHQPFTGETFFADGAGAFLDYDGVKTPLRSRPTATLDDAIVYSTDPTLYMEDRLRARFDVLTNRCRMKRYTGDCYSFSLIAMGTVDLVVEGYLNSYDIIPLIPIIEQSGGVVTSLDGETPLHGGACVASANAQLHEEALAIMNRDPD